MKKKSSLLTDDGQVDELVARGRVREVNATAVEAGIGSAGAVDAQKGREGLRAEVGAAAQTLRICPNICSCKSSILTDIQAGKKERKNE